MDWGRAAFRHEAVEQTVWISRHARTIANESGRMQGWDPYELSPSGAFDCSQASAWWGQRSVGWVICSPVLRAMQTADLLFGRVDDLDAGWSEQAMPEFAGQLATTAHEEYPELIHPDGWSRQDAPRHRALEHIETVENRAICALRNAVLIPREGDIAVVTHGAVLVSLVRAAGLDARVVGNLAVAEVRAHATEGWELVSLHNPLE